MTSYSKIHCIIDIDTTIANNDHRAALLKRKCTECDTEVGSEHRAVCPNCGSEKSHAPQSSWDQFLRHDLMLKDTVQPHAFEVMQSMRMMDYRLVFLTGRNEKHREVTQEWLLKNVGWVEFFEPVLMRPLADENVPASVMKERQFINYMKLSGECGQFDKFMFFEDDRHVLATWRKYGLVFLCPEAWQYLNPEVRTHGEMSWSR